MYYRRHFTNKSKFVVNKIFSTELLKDILDIMYRRIFMLVGSYVELLTELRTNLSTNFLDIMYQWIFPSVRLYVELLTNL